MQFSWGSNKCPKYRLAIACNYKIVSGHKSIFLSKNNVPKPANMMEWRTIACWVTNIHGSDIHGLGYASHMKFYTFQLLPQSFGMLSPSKPWMITHFLMNTWESSHTDTPEEHLQQSMWWHSQCEQPAAASWMTHFCASEARQSLKTKLSNFWQWFRLLRAFTVSSCRLLAYSELWCMFQYIKHFQAGSTCWKSE